MRHDLIQPYEHARKGERPRRDASRRGRSIPHSREQRPPRTGVSAAEILGDGERDAPVARDELGVAVVIGCAPRPARLLVLGVCQLSERPPVAADNGHAVDVQG